MYVFHLTVSFLPVYKSTNNGYDLFDIFDIIILVFGFALETFVAVVSDH